MNVDQKFGLLCVLVATPIARSLIYPTTPNDIVSGQTSSKM